MPTDAKSKIDPALALIAKAIIEAKHHSTKVDMRLSPFQR